MARAAAVIIGGQGDEGEPTERSPLLHNEVFLHDAEHGKIVPDTSTDHGNDIHLADEPSTGKLLLMLAPCWLGAFLSALDSTVVATLSAPISASFNSLSLLTWIASSYFIANAALQPLSGRLTDILSRRDGLVFSNVCFGAGNLISGLATRKWFIIFGRVVAGIGGGGLTAIATFIASDLVPLRKRGVWQGMGNICYGVGAGVGGIFGGWVHDTWGWRYAFFIQVPFTVVAAVLALTFIDIPMKSSEKSKWRRIDVLGAVTLTVFLVLLLLGVNSGGNVAPWTHPLILISLPLAAVFLVVFIVVEARFAEEPIIPVKLLLDRTVLSACLTNLFITTSTFALLFYGPIYFQVKGLTATEAGIRLIPQSLGGAVGSIVGGLVMRWTGRYYWLTVVIIAIFVASCALVSTFHLTTPSWEPFVVLFFSGVGYSGMLTVTLLALISAVEHEHQAVITAASYAFRSVGSTLGISVASAVFQNILQRELLEELGHLDSAADIIKRLRDSLDEIKLSPPLWKAEVMAIYMNALRGVFLTTLGIAILGLLVSLAMREHKLHDNLARK